MDLILWRHAQAQFAHHDLSRELTSKGQQDALVMASFIHNKLPENLRCFASEATRSQETLMALDKPFQISEILNPEAQPALVLPWLFQELQSQSSSLLCVGHQPWLGYVCAQLISCQSDQEQPHFEMNISRACLYWFDISLTSQLGKIHCQLKAVLSPKMVQN